ncbi:MAG: hypothetical protein EOR75_33335 [Mesorhizobium sp.]|nr:MAG: hypothetical protein EOR75_33335 [Mesorhizobium sp.]
MTVAVEGFEKPRLKALLDDLSSIEDPGEPWRVAHRLPELLFLVVCETSVTATTTTPSPLSAGRGFLFCVAIPTAYSSEALVPAVRV